MLLFICGGTPFLMGIVYSTIFPSTNAHVVAPLVIGAVFLVAYALWENLGEKAGLIKYPLTPTRVFTAGWGRDLTAPCIACAVINMFYYSTSILYPTMISVFFTAPGDWHTSVILSIVQGFAILTGVIFLSAFGSVIKKWHHQLTAYTTIMVIFGVLLALGNPQRKGMMIAFVFVSQAAYSAAMYLSIAVCQMGVDQADLGISGGVSGSARFAGGAIATAVYTAVQTNTVKKWMARLIPAAAVAAGLPSGDINSLVSVVGTSTLSQKYNSAIVAAVGSATVKAYEKGIQ